MSNQGLKELEQVLLGEAHPNLSYALERTLKRPVVIVLDESQRFFHEDSGIPLPEFNGVLSFLRTRSDLQGRLLLLSDRVVERARWSEGFPIRTVDKLTEKEAQQLLDDRLQFVGQAGAIPSDRKQDIIRALDCNPRAIETLVATLSYEPLDEIIGSNPGLWAVRDREVSRDFLKKLEHELLERTMSHLDPLHRERLLRLAVHRKSFEKPAFELVCGSTRDEWRKFREVLVTRFLLKHISGWHALNPIVREISLARLKDLPAECVQAHARAADYHLRHFQARTLTVGQAKLYRRA